jgi:exopolyphosphatase/guanosine-5'-triphosphate,3'-diphosphate pyrophosphatase
VKAQRRAVIDIGTNSVKLLAADVAGVRIERRIERSIQTRLGRGLYLDQRLRSQAIADTARVAAQFAQEARLLGAAIRVIATSAARDARNSGKLLAAVRRASRLEVEIISGAQEAAWAFQGVATDPRFAGQPLLILEVGGGSTEFILGQGAVRTFCQSFPLGIVRLSEQLKPSAAPGPGELAGCLAAVRDFLGREVAPLLAPALAAYASASPQLVGTGGTAGVLGAMELSLTEFNPARLETAQLTRAKVRARLEYLWGLPLAQRRKVPGLPPERADVILTGVAIYYSVMERLGFDRLQISARGMRFAALLDDTYPGWRLECASPLPHWGRGRG